MAEALALPPRKRGWPKQGEWTYDDYLKLPDDGRRYEIIEGELCVTNTPGVDHQLVVVELLRQIANFVKANQSGYVLPAPFEVHLSETTRPVQPDALFIKKERWPGPGAKFFTGTPDLVAEVLSPSTLRRDRSLKFTVYEQAGVPEYWIANPRTRSVEVFTLSGAEYALLGEFIEDETIRSKMLPGLEIVTASLFGK